jgi:DNA topoisomerase IA
MISVLFIVESPKDQIKVDPAFSEKKARTAILGHVRRAKHKGL